LVVRHAGLLPFFSPADDDQQRVIDRNPQPDQRHKELHEHRNVGDGRQRPDQKERRRNGDDGHQQGDDCSERTEHEGEHEQRSERGQKRPEQHSGSRSLRVISGRAERVKAGDPYARAPDRDPGECLLREARFRLALIDAAACWDVDERERRAAVGRHERPVASRGVGGDPCRRESRLHASERSCEFVLDVWGIDRCALRQLHDGNERSNVAAAAVDRADLLICLEALASGNAELLRERLSGGADRCERRNRDGDPEAGDESFVIKNPAG
jgi:hypothetical protein